MGCVGDAAAAVALLGTAVGDIHGGPLPSPKAGPVLCWHRAALALLPVGSGGLGLAVALLILGDPLTRTWGTPGEDGWGVPGTPTEPRAHEEGDAHSRPQASRASPGARQVFSLQDFFQPRLEEPVLSICTSAGKGVAQLLCLTTPLPGLVFSPPVPQKRGRSSSQPGEVSQGAARWEKPTLHPRFPCQPGWPPRPSRLSPREIPPAPRTGELWARGFPTEEPEQFGKAVTSLWPGESGM